MPSEVLNFILERCKNKSEVMTERSNDSEPLHSSEQLFQFKNTYIILE